ncbi:MAG: D-glycero-beta-D-manno-heptose 1,7-bisphosphate 7-phosphatase [Porticoccaceae bacterium]|nr:D-glycero-beta-D-manno-heptose 1,7-bisphosphate 7-phosphatase [Porticoccaceae bacterium]
MKLIILDRDGVINHDSDDYVKNANEWIPLPGSIEAIGKLSKAGYTVAIATNQSGLSRGLFGLDELEDMHKKMCDLVEDAGGHIDGIFYCPHLPEDQCQCRKPAPGLLKAIAEEFQISLQKVPVVGDSIRDLQAGLALGCQAILVRTGKGKVSEHLLQKDNTELINTPVFDDLNAVVTNLIDRQR